MQFGAPKCSRWGRIHLKEHIWFLFHVHRAHGYLCASAQTFFIEKCKNMYFERTFKFHCSDMVMINLFMTMWHIIIFRKKYRFFQNYYFFTLPHFGEYGIWSGIWRGVARLHSSVTKSQNIMSHQKFRNSVPYVRQTL